MSSVISALDNYTPMQLGENMHVEYGWSNDFKESIVQLFFQLVRTKNSENIEGLSKLFYKISGGLGTDGASSPLPAEYLKIIICMIFNTRDIVEGKGECLLSYMLLFTFYKVFPEIAISIVKFFVLAPEKDTHPLGSWKDMKCFADYVYQKNSKNADHPLIKECVRLINKQLNDDLTNDTPSLCAKWVPRETSKYSWFFKELAQHWCGRSVKNNYVYMNYRKTITALNKKLDTVQIKQCGKTWADIDHNKTTSITLVKNKRAFLNLKRCRGKKSSEEVLRYDVPDRITCAENFTNYIKTRISTGENVKGKRIGMETFTEEAFKLFHERGSVEYDMLNSQWKDNSSQTNKLDKMIAMVDTSGSMEGSPLHCAIAMGIRVAEKSLLGKRVLTFSNTPTWHNLDNCENFIDCVDTLRCASWCMNTNFTAALTLILDSLKQKNVPPEDARDLILVIFSDMQIDEADNCVLYDEIEKMYNAAGYQIPHILFWNLRSTSGFPVLSSQKNASMLSGYSPALLNSFCENGMDALKELTPWNNFLTTIMKVRYLHLSAALDNTIYDIVRM